MENEQQTTYAKVICWPSYAFYALLAVAVALLVYMSMIAWRNSQPFTCADNNIDYVKGVATCIVPLSELNEGIKE